MKRNAVLRIVLWSTALLVLLSILFVFLYVPGAGRRMRGETTAETLAAIVLPMVDNVDSASANAVVTASQDIYRTPEQTGEVVAYAERGTTLQILRQEQIGGKIWGYIGAPTLGWIDMNYVNLLEPVASRTEESTEAPTSPDEGQYNALVTADGLNVRTMPSTEAPTAGMVKKGDHLLITKQEIVNEISWGYTPSPVNGWVVMDYVELLDQTDVQISTMETTASPEEEVTGYGVALDAASIREMEIEWAAGSIKIQPMEITEIRIAEEGKDREKNPMVWNVREGKLSIQYSKNTDHAFGMGLVLGKEESKNLIIEVPFGWQCDSLEIDAASASLEVQELTIREMEFDGASGTCIFDNCTVEKLDLDTASGDVRFTGSLQQLDCDSASADILLELTNVPRSIELDTASGDLEVTLPADAGFAVTLDALSSDFRSDFDTIRRNNSYVAGNGRCRIDVDAMSGDVTVRKAA